MPTAEFSESDFRLWREAHRVDPTSKTSLRNIQTWRRDELIDVEFPGSSGRGLAAVYSDRAIEEVLLIEQLMRRFKNRNLVALALFASGYDLPLSRVRSAYAAAYTRLTVKARAIWMVLNDPRPASPHAREVLHQARKAAADKWWRQGFREIRRLSGGARRGVMIEGIRRSVYTQLFAMVLGVRLEPGPEGFDEVLRVLGLAEAYEHEFGTDKGRKTTFMRELLHAARLRTLNRTAQESSLVSLRRALDVTRSFLDVLPIPSGDLEVALVAPVVAQFPEAQDGLLAIADYVRKHRD